MEGRFIRGDSDNGERNSEIGSGPLDSTRVNMRKDSTVGSRAESKRGPYAVSSVS